MFNTTDHYVILDDEAYMSLIKFKLIESNQDLDDVVEYLKKLRDIKDRKIFHPIRLKNLKIITDGLKKQNTLPYCVIYNESQVGVYFVMDNKFYYQLEPTLNPNYVKSEFPFNMNAWNKYREERKNNLKNLDRITFIKSYSHGEIFFVNYRYQEKNIKMKYLQEHTFDWNFKEFEKTLFYKELQETI